MLEFTLQQYPFRFGLDEGTDPHQQPPGRLVTAENCEWVKGGRLQKRGGAADDFSETWYSGSTTGSLSAGKRLFMRGSELCMTDGSYAYVWNSARSAWQRVDQVPDVGMTWKTILDPYDGVSATDAAYTGSYVVHAWTTGDPLNFAVQAKGWAQVLDTNGGVVVAATNIANNCHGVRVVSNGTHTFLVWREGISIYGKYFDEATVSFSAAVTLTSSALTTAGFDAMLVGDDLVIAFEHLISNVLTVQRRTYVVGTNTYTVAANSGVTSETSTDFRCIALDGAAGEVIYVAYGDRTGQLVRIATVNASTMVEVTAPVTLETGTSPLNVSVKRMDASNALVGWSYGQSSPTRGRFTSVKVSSTLTIDTASKRGTWGSRLISRIFALGSKYYALALDFPISGSSSALDGANSCLVEVETSDKIYSDHIPHRYLGKLDPLVGGLSLQGFLPSALAISATEALVPVPFLSTAPRTTSNWRCGVRMASVTIGASLPTDMWRTVTYGNEAYMGGALLHAYDGRSVFDYGFSRAPILAESQSSSPTAGSIGVGTYLYGFVLEYRSSAGVLHRSPTALASVTAAGATATNTLTLVGTDFTSKIDIASGGPLSSNPILLRVHRSTAGGSAYYSLTFEPRYVVITYDISAASQALSDTSADASILASSIALSTRPLIYTTGGILDDEQPPNLLTLALHKSRLWGVAGDKRTLWFSKSFQDDLGVAPGFSTSFRISVEADVTALWTMDEKLVVASADRLWYLVGGDAGPNATGQGSDIQGPFAIQSDVGCTNPRSVVSTPDGTMFESDGKLYLLTRGLEVVWLGRPVQDKLASFPNVTSAVLVPTKNQVRFTCNNSDSTAHTVLVYDYVEKQWSTFRYLAGTVGIADALVYGGTYHFLTTAGSVYRESSSSYLDAGSWVTMTLETAWISAAGPLAFQSVRRFALHGVSNTNHDLTVSVGFDRDTSYAQAGTPWLAGSAVTTVGPLEAAEVHIGNRRKCSAIRLKVVDATPTTPGTYPVTTGQGPAFDSMGIEVGIKKGFQKKPATKRG